ATLAFLMFLLIFTSFPFEVNASYSIRSHTFCKDVDTSQYPYKPINPTSIFYRTEENAILLVILDNVMVPHIATLKWIGPDGTTLPRDIQIHDPKSEGLDYYTDYSLAFSLPIKDAPDEVLGIWKVEFYIDGQFKFSDQFELKSGSAPSGLEVGVYLAKEVFQVGEEVDLSLYVSRGVYESYLKLTGPRTMTDNIGSFESETYISYTLGVAERGDVGTWKITFTGCYSHNGQERCDSDAKTFRIVTKLEELPPEIFIIAKPDKTSVSVDERLQLSVNLKNEGNGKAININTEISSDNFELISGSKSWDLDSLAPGGTSQVKTFSFKTKGPMGDGKITITTTYSDELGKQYQKTEVVTIKITQAIVFQLTNFYDADKFTDYLSRFMESPYPVYNVIEITVPNGGKINNAYLEVSGLEVDRIELNDIGGGRYQAEIKPFERFSSEDIRDMTWSMMRNIAGTNNLELPQPNWNWRDPSGGWPAIQLDSIYVSFEDGTEVRRRVDSTIPTLMDALQSNAQNWGEGTFIVALSEGKPPADIFVRNPSGLSIGTNIDESGNPTLVSAIPGSFYSGRDSNPQFIFTPSSSGETLIKTFGKKDGSMDLLIFNLMGSHGSTEIRRSIQIKKGGISEYTSIISEEGVVESLEPKAAFPWLQLDKTWPIFVAIPVVFGLITIFVIKRRRAQPRYIGPTEDAPPQTIPEEIPGDR
ncbi:MAG: hypothetical protein NWE86_04470, partial [Candidatus Bathyarchaeota archaeon]|nr:hypothetical protein [Candidatus Bathyarchaeota archaeon]